jgi:hypothetical protein
MVLAQSASLMRAWVVLSALLTTRGSMPSGWRDSRPFPIHLSWPIEDELHLTVFDDGLVQQLVVLHKFLRMRRHIGSSVNHNSLNMFNKEVIDAW